LLLLMNVRRTYS